MIPQPRLGVAVLPVTPFAQNCTLVFDRLSQNEKGLYAAAVIDPGGEIETILAEAQSHALAIEQIWLTHGHADHAGGAGLLKDKLSIPIIGPAEGDKFWLDRIVSDGKSFGLGTCAPCIPDRWLQDGDEVTIGGLIFHVIHCPGHTPGHVVFYQKEAGFAQVGDVIFQGSIGRTDFPRGDYQTLIDSITQKLWPLGSEVVFVPGHGPSSSFGEERQYNPFVSDVRLGLAKSSRP